MRVKIKRTILTIFYGGIKCGRNVFEGKILVDIEQLVKNRKLFLFCIAFGIRNLHRISILFEFFSLVY